MEEVMSSMEKPPPPPDEDSPEYVQYIIKYGSPKKWTEPDYKYEDCPWKDPMVWVVLVIVGLIILCIL